MTDLPVPSPLPVDAAVTRPTTPRRPYRAPQVQPLGPWTALTLTNSLPIGPGGMVFGGNTDA